MTPELPFDLTLPDLSLPEDSTWANAVSSFMHSEVGKGIVAHLEATIAAGDPVYPPVVFRALQLTPFAKTRVVILGQDPYHNPCQAEGLAFSVPEGMKIPPSLRNIKKELMADQGIPMTKNTSLVPWAKQGVLLLNSVLTVTMNKPGAHAKWGWQTLIDKLIHLLSEKQKHCVFLLWGAYAQSKRPLIDERKHLVLTANHPSPLSALRSPEPFLGCRHFSQTNAWLAERGLGEIDWNI